MLMTDTRAGFDPSDLLEIIGDDREFLGEFVAVFQDEAVRLLGEVQKSARRLDAPGLERSAHALKGMLSYFGDSAALDLARRLEALGREQDVDGTERLASDLRDEVALILEGLDRL